MKLWKSFTIFKNDKWEVSVDREFNILERQGWTIESFEFIDKSFILVVCSMDATMLNEKQQEELVPELRWIKQWSDTKPLSIPEGPY